jgi:ElaB/YqjD/DUF883 family membrane-anchored ribosome-binding protein
MKKSDATQTSAELLEDLRALLADAEKTLSASGSEHAEDAIAALRERFESARERFAELYAGARKKVIAGAKYTDDAIRENPYQSLAIALGLGLLVGVLLGRSSKCSK